MNQEFYSQFDEDRILNEIFEGKRTGFCVEVGANDGVSGSNTYFFERLGWNCVLVEPNPSLCQEIRATRKAKLFECAASSSAGRSTLFVAHGADFAHGVSAVGDSGEAHVKAFGFDAIPVEVRTRTLDSILEESGLAKQLDFVSIDVEGHELDVLRGFDLVRWRPAIVIIEDNNRFASTDVRSHLDRFGYVPIRRTGVNDWYVPSGSWLNRRKSRFIYEATRVTSRVRATVASVDFLRESYRWIRRRK